MGLRDIFDAGVQSNPVSAGAASGAQWLGEQFIEHQSESARRAPGLPQPEAGRGQAMPGQPGRNIRVTGENAVADAASEWNRQNVATAESIIGGYKAAKAIVTHPRRSYQTAKTTVHEIQRDPGLLVDVGKSVAVDMAIGAALNPATYVGGGMLLVAETAELSAARSAERAVARTTERGLRRAAERTAVHGTEEVVEGFAARSADEIAQSLAPAGLDKAMVATARRADPSRAARALEAIDVGDANVRETLTGNPSGRLGQKRIDIGERLMPGPQPTIPRALAKDVLQANPTMPSEGAALGYRTAKWRATQVGRRLVMPAQARTARRVGQILYDPRRALTDPAAQSWALQGAEWAVREHPEAVAAVGGVVAASQAFGAYSTFKSLTGGSDDEGAVEKPKTVTEPSARPDTVQSIGLMQFRADQTRATSISRRSRPRQLGVVTSNTMPTEIGPSDWYGPAAGYEPGRGFQSRDVSSSGPLTPLEQPGDFEDAEMAGTG